MKISVIGAIGTSPPVVTEFVQYVEDMLKEHINDLIVICTSDPFVRSCTDLAEQAVKDRYPHINFHRHELEFEDLDSEKKVSGFLLDMVKLLKRQVNMYGANKIYINAAGGRKDSILALSLVSQLFPVSGIFHVIMPDVKSFNIELERKHVEIEGFGKTEDKKSYYLIHKDIFEPLMYPPQSSYSVIKIPTIPYPPAYLQKLAQILDRNKTIIIKSGLSFDYIGRCVDIGLLQSDGKYLYPTDEGRLVAKILRSSLGVRE